MEVYSETGFIKDIYDSSMDLIAIALRVHLVENEDPKTEYLEPFLEWLEYKKFRVHAYTAGKHINTNNPHIHIHLVCSQGKIYTNPIFTMKTDYNNNKVGNKKFISRKYKGKINMSLQMNVLVKVKTKGFLQYPLKEIEQLPDERLVGYDLANTIWTIEELCLAANIEYKRALAGREKKEIKEKEKLTEWEELIEYMDKQIYDTTLQWYGETNILGEVLKLLVIYYRQRAKPPSMKLIWDRTEQYCFHKGYIGEEYIMYKFRRI